MEYQEEVKRKGSKENPQKNICRIIEETIKTENNEEGGIFF